MEKKEKLEEEKTFQFPMFICFRIQYCLLSSLLNHHHFVFFAFFMLYRISQKYKNNKNNKKKTFTLFTSIAIELNLLGNCCSMSVLELLAVMFFLT